MTPENNPRSAQNPGIKDKLTTRSYLNGSPRVCAYAGCLTTLSDDMLFRYCETCRPLAAAENITHALDPFSPLSNPADVEIPCQTVLTELTGEEILNHGKRIELYYLNYCKVVKLRGLEQPTKTKVFQTTAEWTEEVRANIGIEGELAARTAEAKKLEAKKRADARRAEQIASGEIKPKQSKQEAKIEKLMKMRMTREEAIAFLADEDFGF